MVIERISVLSFSIPIVALLAFVHPKHLVTLFISLLQLMRNLIKVSHVLVHKLLKKRNGLLRVLVVYWDHVAREQVDDLAEGHSLVVIGVNHLQQVHDFFFSLNCLHSQNQVSEFFLIYYSVVIVV